MNYSEQLRHPSWQRKRLQMLEASGWACRMCGDKESTLHVHHKKYVKGRMAWEYPDEDLPVLCERCHKEEHLNIDILKRLIESVSQELPVYIGLIAGFAEENGVDIEEELLEAAKNANRATYSAGAAAFHCYMGREVD